MLLPLEISSWESPWPQVVIVPSIVAEDEDEELDEVEEIVVEPVAPVEQVDDFNEDDFDDDFDDDFEEEPDDDDYAAGVREDEANSEAAPGDADFEDP
jgi:hypothetical protein